MTRISSDGHKPNIVQSSNMPSTSCSVVNCTNHSKKLRKAKQEKCCIHQSIKGVCGCIPFTLHKFPVETELRKKWISAINRQTSINDKTPWQPGRYAVVCSDHFIDNQPTESNPLPTLKLGYNVSLQLGKLPSIRTTRTSASRTIPDTQTISKQEISKELLIYDQAIQPDQNKLSAEAFDLTVAAGTNDCFSDLEVKPKVATLPNELCTGATTKNQLQKTQGQLYCKNLQLKSKDHQLRHHLQPLHKKLLRTDNQVVFYTGLPSIPAFECVCKYVQKFINQRTRKVTHQPKYRRIATQKRTVKLPVESKILLALMKMRLGLLHRDLADRFNISLMDVSVTFSEMVRSLSKALKPLIVFYERSEVSKTLPKEYHSYRRLRCIIDCTEIFIQRPSNLKDQSATWSDYKHHHTVKALIAISPQGNICYVSELFGGRTSDRYIVTNSNFLDYINPGDQVLADRGFPIRELLLIKQAELVLPPAGKGKSQFTSNEVKQTKKVANNRIHVERVIQRLKKFRILTQVLPVTLLRHANNMLLVCAAITNLSSPIVSTWSTEFE